MQRNHGCPEGGVVRLDVGCSKYDIKIDRLLMQTPSIVPEEGRTKLDELEEVEVAVAAPASAGGGRGIV